MTLGEWLASRAPAPPAELAGGVRRALGPALQCDLAGAPERLMTAAEELLATLLTQECTGRPQALALLTVDALTTYAFEAAAEAGQNPGPVADAAVARIAALAGGA